MSELEPMDARLSRLRAQTEGLLPPAGLAARLTEHAVARARARGWDVALVAAGRRGLVVAAVAAAAAVLFATLVDRPPEHGPPLAESMEWSP